MRLEAEPSCQFLPFPAGYLQRQQIPGALGQGFPALSMAPARSPQHLGFGVSSGESRAVGSGVGGDSDGGGLYKAILCPSLLGVLAGPRSARKADCISMSCSHL